MAFSLASESVSSDGQRDKHSPLLGIDSVKYIAMIVMWCC